MATKAQLKAVAKYDKANTVQVNLKLNKKTDADLIDLLNKQDNKQGFIKLLLRTYAFVNKARVDTVDNILQALKEIENA